MNKDKRGMTFLEVIVVLAILLVVAGIFIWVYYRFYLGAADVAEEYDKLNIDVNVAACKGFCEGAPNLKNAYCNNPRTIKYKVGDKWKELEASCYQLAYRIGDAKIVLTAFKEIYPNIEFAKCDDEYNCEVSTVVTGECIAKGDANSICAALQNAETCNPKLGCSYQSVDGTELCVVERSECEAVKTEIDCKDVCEWKPTTS